LINCIWKHFTNATIKEFNKITIKYVIIWRTI
jgi:hypothetical protein